MLLRLSITYGILPSELNNKMSLEDFMLLCSYISFEPLPTNKIDISQAVLASTIAGLFNEVKFENFMNPWIKEKVIDKGLTEEESKEAAIKMAMEFSHEYEFDTDGNKIPYKERLEYFKSGKANGSRTIDIHRKDTVIKTKRERK